MKEITTINLNKIKLLNKLKLKKDLLFHLSILREPKYIKQINLINKKYNKILLKNQKLKTINYSLKEEKEKLKNSNIEYMNSIKKLENNQINYKEIEKLKEINNKNKEEIKKDFNNKKELAKLVKKYKDEVDELKKQIEYFEKNPSIKILSEDNNRDIGFLFEVKEANPLQSTIINNSSVKSFDFLKGSSQDNNFKPLKRTLNAPKKSLKVSKKLIKPSKIINESLNESSIITELNIPEPIKRQKKKPRINKKQTQQSIDIKAKETNFMEILPKDEPKKSFFSAISFDDSFFS